MKRFFKLVALALVLTPIALTINTVAPTFASMPTDQTRRSLANSDGLGCYMSGGELAQKKKMLSQPQAEYWCECAGRTVWANASMAKAYDHLHGRIAPDYKRRLYNAMNACMGRAFLYDEPNYSAFLVWVIANPFM